MISKQSFYFVRHGQTDNNVKNVLTGPSDVPLNQHGIKQAQSLHATISNLPLKSLCCSPLARARQTKDLAIPSHNLPEKFITDLMEVSPGLWLEIQRCLKDACRKPPPALQDKFASIINGINTALETPAPTLVVAHGGIYSSLIYLLQITDAPKTIDNCQLVHFTYYEKWQVNFLDA